MDSIADLIGFNDWQPLINFETRFGFNSRRKFIEDKIVQWLDTAGINSPNYPDDLDGADECLRTLLNVDGNMMIDSIIFSLINDTIFFDNCKRIKSNGNHFIYDNGNKYFRVKVSVISLIHVHTMSGKIISFKFKNGKPKRSRANLYVRVAGSDRDADCNYPLSDGAYKGWKKRKSLTATSWLWNPPTWIKHKKNETAAYGTLKDSKGNNHYGSVILTW